MELREKFHDYRALLEKSVKWNEIDYIKSILLSYMKFG